jgi:hypothetical protein
MSGSVCTLLDEVWRMDADECGQNLTLARTSELVLINTKLQLCQGTLFPEDWTSMSLLQYMYLSFLLPCWLCLRSVIRRCQLAAESGVPRVPCTYTLASVVSYRVFPTIMTITYLICLKKPPFVNDVNMSRTSRPNWSVATECPPCKGLGLGTPDTEL